MTATIAIDDRQPLLVFGGPYSNLEATVAIKAVADQLGILPGNTICTGDVVAYAANPEETAQLIRNWGVHVVAGNCEEQLAAGAADCGCGFEEGSACDQLSRGWYPYALARVSPDTCAWMGTLPPSLAFSYQDFRCVAIHGGATQNNKFLFASETDALTAEAETLDADIVLAGHAGLPFVTRAGCATWVNAGVIGMPANDGTPDGWYAVITPDDGGIRVALKRLAYDHLSAAAAMRRSGHANGYARTLVDGIWPSLDVLPPDETAQAGVKLRQRTVRLKHPLAAAA
ncbi:MAG: metallophosphoesterase family protein [Hyphomicrobiaceae bacterium]|nr:metallophosphoesterase family protein [Hyphomicrobiaceae bacterium]